jgi:hypothetical protein
MAAACATAFLDFNLRVPGHAILRAVFPMAFGLALAPRQFAGAVMGASAMLSVGLLNFAGAAQVGFGAMTSLALTGPLLDLALWRARRGIGIYFGLAMAGLASNMVALAIRATAKALGLDGPGTRGLANWWPQAVVTYALCGLLAGGLGAFIWFRFAASKPDREAGP